LSRPSVHAAFLDVEAVRRLTRQIDQVCELMARLSGSNVPAADFFQALVTRTLAVINGTAGAVWLRSPQGMLQLQHQTNLGLVGLEDRPVGRQAHHELLRQAFESRQLLMLDPDAKIVLPDGREPANYSAYPVVVAPVLSEQGDPLGLYEVWLEANTDVRLRTKQVEFIVTMAGYASNYLRQSSALRNSVQEQVFTQLEAFSRQVHASLNPTEVAFLVANEGRRLIGCDRISVGVRHGRRATVEAVSGSDVVEKASVQVKKMRDLFDAVLDWNEKLLYRGEVDPSLPPAVHAALDSYLHESNPKLLILQPLRDEREQIKDKEKEAKSGPARSALLLESYEPPEMIDPLAQRFDIVAGHAAPALYNAAEMRRVPLRFLWRPVMALQARAGGKRRFYTLLALGLFAALLAALIFIPYPLKLDAKGQLVPEERHYVYPTGQGRVVRFKVTQGQPVRPNTPIAVMVDRDMAREIGEKEAEVRKSEKLCALLNAQSTDANLPAAKRKEKADELDRERENLRSLTDQMRRMLEEYHADPENPGEFTVYAPEFPRARNARGPAEWKVLTADFAEQLVNKWMKPSDPLLRVGNTKGAWQIEMKIPQKSISQVLRAYRTNDPNEYLEVDVLLVSAATEQYKGRLYRRDVMAEAVQNKDDHNESELVVYAYVRVNDPDMPAEEHIPEERLTTGVEVHAKIRCGNHSLGYSLFHGAWEFFYEHVIFAF
jgi:hypothetical protein